MAFAPAAYASAVGKLLNGQFDAGLADLRKVIAQDPLITDAALRSDMMRRGIAALRSGKVGEALEAMQATLAVAPESSEVCRLLGAAEIVNGDVMPAIGHLRDAVRLN